MSEFLETARKMVFSGGILNYLILAFYFVMLFVVIQRIVFFASTKYSRKSILEKISSLASKDEIPEILSKEKDGTAPKAIISRFFEKIDAPAEVLNEALDRKADEIQSEMSRNLEILSIIAACAPLLGLLGTVTGLMSAFSAIEKTGNSVEMSSLAGGIWSAMITTATGLIASIPSLVFHKLFENIANSRLRDISHVISILKEKFRSDALKD